jgi:hypothetical protein
VFWVTAVFILTSQALLSTTLLPDAAQSVLQQIQNSVNNIIAAAGMRGLLIGIAFGVITLSLRVLLGFDQPYSK